MVNEGSLKAGKIKVEKNGKQVQLLDVNKARFEFPLEYDCTYIFSFIHNGYITKKVEVVTNVPKEKQSLEFEPFKFDVEIFKQYAGVNTVIYNQPVGKIKFNDVLNEFDYDTDYTKSIQSELARVEEELREKAKEEAERLKAEASEKAAEETKRKADEAARKEAEFLAKKNAGAGSAQKSNGGGQQTQLQNDLQGNKGVSGSSTPAGSNKAKQILTGGGMITMRVYTAAEYGYNIGSYGWVNYGNGAGIVEIKNKEEYESIRRELMMR